jgi:hypothetical protein
VIKFAEFVTLIIVHYKAHRRKDCRHFLGFLALSVVLECVADITCTKTGSSEVSSIAMKSLAILMAPMEKWPLSLPSRYQMTET